MSIDPFEESASNAFPYAMYEIEDEIIASPANFDKDEVIFDPILEPYRYLLEYIERLCNNNKAQQMDEDCNIFLKTIQCLYGLKHLGKIDTKTLCEHVQARQSRDAPSTTQLDAFSQEPITRVPTPFLVAHRAKEASDHIYYFNILDFATNSPVSFRNPYTNQLFSSEMIAELKTRISVLQNVILFALPNTDQKFFTI